MSNITAPQTSCNQSHKMIGIQLKIWEWPPLTRAFPDLTLSLPHSQISEASPSCELTRWSGMGGSDPKDPSLTHPLLPSPRFLLNGTFLRFTVTEGSAGPNQCLSFVGVGRLLFIYGNPFRILHWRLSQQSHKSTDVKESTTLSSHMQILRTVRVRTGKRGGSLGSRCKDDTGRPTRWPWRACQRDLTPSNMDFLILCNLSMTFWQWDRAVRSDFDPDFLSRPCLYSSLYKLWTRNIS